jgi:hypothetical protein
MATTPQTLSVIGQQGAIAGATLGGGTAVGAPTSGTWAAGNFIIDQTGVTWICTVAGTPGTWVASNDATKLSGIVPTANGGTGSSLWTPGQLGSEWGPYDQGADSWTHDPSQGGTSSGAITAAGTIYLCALPRRKTKTITGSVYYRTTGTQGNTITNGWIALYNAAGTLIGYSDQSSNFQAAVGNFTATLTSVVSFTNLPAGIYYLGFYCGGATTVPTFYMGNSGSTAMLNAGGSTASLAGGLRVCTQNIGTGIAAASAPAISGAVSISGAGNLISAVLV